MIDLIATKSLKYPRGNTYMTRMLQPGDGFQAKPGDARLLIAAKRAKAAEEPQADALTLLRAEYADVVGKKAYHGWDADTLRQKIADHEPDGDD